MQGTVIRGDRVRRYNSAQRRCRGRHNLVEAAVGDISKLLRAWSGRDQSDLEGLAPVYDELHRLARRYMKRDRPGHSLSHGFGELRPAAPDEL